MRLIHKNDFCRDIAIWYDEFLSPGENFNDSIRKALQKSGLFVLAVTPNLINETNYIMTTEYPMAKKNGKPILPVELVPTDREQLSEKYEDIPNPTDAHNETVLSETLLESIKNMSIKENDASPEHDFLIGLAYIGGIDVEKDLEIALCCFTNAAENGVMEAMKKLSHMYFYADGTAKDIEKSYFWHRKYIENLVLSFEQTLTTESAIIVSTERLNYALMLESDKLSVLSLSIAEQEYKENIRFYETILNSMSLEKSCKEVYMSELAECYYAIGSFYKWKNYLLQATEYYLRTVGIYEILTDLKHWRYCIKLIQCYEQLFYTYIQLNQIEDAECFVLKRISILEKYSKSEIKTEGKVSNFEWHYKKELADSYHIAGYYYDKINSLDRAVECYVNSIKLFKEWLTVDEDDIYCLIEVYNDIQKLYKANGQLDKLLELYIDEFDVFFKSSVECQDNNVARFSMLSVRIIHMLVQQKNGVKLIEYLNIVLPLWNRFYSEGKVQSYDSLSSGYYIVGLIFMNNKQLNKALTCLNIAVSILEIVINNSKTYKGNLKEAYKALASAYKMKGEYEMANCYDEKAKIL